MENEAAIEFTESLFHLIGEEIYSHRPGKKKRADISDFMLVDGEDKVGRFFAYCELADYMQIGSIISEHFYLTHEGIAADDVVLDDQFGNFKNTDCSFLFPFDIDGIYQETSPGTFVVFSDGKKDTFSFSFCHPSGKIYLEDIVLYISFQTGYSIEECYFLIYQSNIAKRKAKKIGLHYWPALFCVNSIPPYVYVEVEKYLFSFCENIKKLDGDFSFWDIEGVNGVSAFFVKSAFIACDNQLSEKFWLSIYSTKFTNQYGETRFSSNKGVIPKLDWSVEDFSAFLEGKSFLEENKEYFPHLLSLLPCESVIALGEMPKNLRWAALYGLEDESMAKHRVLKKKGKDVLCLDLVEEATKGIKSASRYMPEKPARKALWEHYVPELFSRFSFIEGFDLLVKDPTSLPLPELRYWLSLAESQEDVLPITNLVRLFHKDRKALLRFVGDASLHDAGQFSLPVQPIRKGWGPLVLQAPTILHWASSFLDIEQTLCGRIPANPAEFRQVAKELQKDCPVAWKKANLSVTEMEDYEEFFTKNPHKKYEMIPAPGGVFGITLGKCHLRQLSAFDKTQVIAGRLVHCCQHLHGAASSCAKQSWTEAGCAIWAVYDKTGMIGQSFVWRSKNDFLVFDSIECLSGHENVVSSLFLEAARSVLGKMGIIGILVGKTRYGATGKLLAHAEEKVFQAPKAVFRLQYTDAELVQPLFLMDSKETVKLLKKAGKENENIILNEAFVNNFIAENILHENYFAQLGIDI